MLKVNFTANKFFSVLDRCLFKQITIFSDATLRAMAAARPRTEAEFLAIPGVGEVKLRRFGSLFLEEIRKSAEK